MGKSRGVYILALLMMVGGCAAGTVKPYDRAIENYSRGRMDASIEDYRQAIRLNPVDPRPRFNLAVILQDEGRLDEAEMVYLGILEQHPDYSPALSNLASIQEKRGQRDAAEQTYRRAMAADRDDAWTASQFGYFLLRTGRADDAAVVFEETIKRSPRCANAWFGLAEIEEGKGDYRGALRNYDKAQLYNPSDLDAYIRPAVLRAARGDTDAAIGLLRKAAHLAPRRGDIQLTLGTLLVRAGKWKEAEKALEAARANGAPRDECDRELSMVYGKLAEAAAAGTLDGGTPPR